MGVATRLNHGINSLLPRVMPPGGMGYNHGKSVINFMPRNPRILLEDSNKDYTYFVIISTLGMGECACCNCPLYLK